MSRSKEQVHLCCELSEIEADFAAEMMRMCGLTSHGDLVRLGLYHLSRHLDVPVGNEVFAMRRRTSLKPGKLRRRTA